MGAPWLQRKLYRCRQCEAQFLHDQGHRHACFTCPQRPLSRTQLLEQFLFAGRTYCPAIEPER